MKTVLRHLPTEISADKLDETKDLFQEALHKNANLVLNAAAVKRVDRTGLDYLAGMRDILEKRQLSLTIFNDTGEIQRLFDINNIDGQRMDDRPMDRIQIRPAA